MRGQNVQKDKGNATSFVDSAWIRNDYFLSPCGTYAGSFFSA